MKTITIILILLVAVSSLIAVDQSVVDAYAAASASKVAKEAQTIYGADEVPMIREEAVQHAEILAMSGNNTHDAAVAQKVLRMIWAHRASVYATMDVGGGLFTQKDITIQMHAAHYQIHQKTGEKSAFRKAELDKYTALVKKYLGR